MLLDVMTEAAQKKAAKKNMARKCEGGCGKVVGNKGGLFSTCNPCRAKDCQHLEVHYDSVLNKVCDGCGTVLRRMKLPFVRIPDADMDIVVAMLAQGKSVDEIHKITNVMKKTIERVKDGSYKSTKNIVGCC